MTNEQVLVTAAQQSYAALYLNRTTRLGPGRSHWMEQLARLMPDERRVLEAKLERWEELKQRSQLGDNVVDIASRQAAPVWGSELLRKAL